RSSTATKSPYRLVKLTTSIMHQPSSYAIAYRITRGPDIVAGSCGRRWIPVPQMNQHRRHATMAVERGLESLTADRPRGPGDQPQLAGVLGPILPVAAQRRQKGSRIGSVVPLDPLGDGTRLCLAELERGPRRDGPQVGFQALPTLREINQDRIAKFELTTVDNRPSSLVFLEDDTTVASQYFINMMYE